MLDLALNKAAEFEPAAIVLGSTVRGQFTVPPQCEKAAQEYSDADSFTARARSDVAFRIQPVDMNVSDGTIGDEGTFLGTIDLPPGKAGT